MATPPEKIKGNKSLLFFFGRLPYWGAECNFIQANSVGISMVGDGIIDAVVLAWILSFPGSSGPTGSTSRERR